MWTAFGGPPGEKYLWLDSLLRFCELFSRTDYKSALRIFVPAQALETSSKYLFEAHNLSTSWSHSFFNASSSLVL